MRRSIVVVTLHDDDDDSDSSHTCVYVGVYMLAGDPWIRTHERTHARTADARNHNKP